MLRESGEPQSEVIRATVLPSARVVPPAVLTTAGWPHPGLHYGPFHLYYGYWPESPGPGCCCSAVRQPAEPQPAGVGPGRGEKRPVIRYESLHFRPSNSASDFDSAVSVLLLPSDPSRPLLTTQSIFCLSPCVCHSLLSKTNRSPGSLLSSSQDLSPNGRTAAEVMYMHDQIGLLDVRTTPPSHLSIALNPQHCPCSFGGRARLRATQTTSTARAAAKAFAAAFECTVTRMTPHVMDYPPIRWP